MMYSAKGKMVFSHASLSSLQPLNSHFCKSDSSGVMTPTPGVSSIPFFFMKMKPSSAISLKIYTLKLRRQAEKHTGLGDSDALWDQMMLGRNELEASISTGSGSSSYENSN